ncbi:MAG: PAAR domain-containing protein [Bacteroidota bacterium]
MPPAARVTDVTNHGGTIIGPGIPTVLIEGLPAAVATDNHVCAIPPPAHGPTASIFPIGSTTVLIGGKPALRTSDTCLCGAAAAVGAVTVLIG